MCAQRRLEDTEKLDVSLWEGWWERGCYRRVALFALYPPVLFGFFAVSVYFFKQFFKLVISRIASSHITSLFSCS